MGKSVSIIIPIYNVEQYIENTLRSALDQTYKNIEYILVDDCGSDNSIKIVQELIASDEYKAKVVKIVKHECNKGVSVARNTGVEHSSSDYIYFLDSDDIITPNCIEQHINAINNSSDIDYTIGGIETIGSKTIHICKLRDETIEASVVDAFFKRTWDPGPCNKLIKRNFLINNNILFKEGIRFEDILWSYQMSKNAKKVRLVAEQTYKYMIHKGSFVTSKNSVTKVNDLLTVIKAINDDKINEESLPSRNIYISFLKFNAALLLLNFNGTKGEKKDLYKQIKQIKSFQLNIYNIILAFPYWLFNLLFTPIYKAYKSRQ